MDDFKKYFYNCINNRSLLEITIFCRKKKDPGFQFRFKYKSSVYDGLVNLEIIEFNRFINKSSSKKTISPFGNASEIVFTTCIDMITDIVKKGYKEAFIIGISCDNIVPNNNNYEFEIDKTIDEFEDCPVCKTVLYDNYPVVLDCEHVICRDCLIDISKTNPKCPICRAHLGNLT